MTQVNNKYLFNFSASYEGGGYKRLCAFLREFNSQGGAYFILHPNCKSLANKFDKNIYFFIKQTKLGRLINDCGYLSKINHDLKNIDLYYSYGIPIYFKVAKINWFHISNILPLAPLNIPMSLFDQIKMRILGRRIRRNFVNANVISAESNFSLSLLDRSLKRKLFLSPNGADDELSSLKEEKLHKKKDIAVVVGTYRYKAILESFFVFENLRRTQCPNLKLVIIGPVKSIPKKVSLNNNVLVKGILPRADVINYLKKSKYYISTTYIENSYNAASEGLFLASESYISDIEPHKELLSNSCYKKVIIPRLSREILHVQKSNLYNINIKSWQTVIYETISKINEALKAHSFDEEI